jgi:nucleotide-binding universal stress UspA family protein
MTNQCLAAMKEIVVAIDFSKGSLHALDYAIALANHCKCNITMVWVDSQSSTLMPLQAEVTELRDEARKNMEELILANKYKLRHSKLNFKLRKGKVYQEMAVQAKLLDASLVITGTHGVTGFEEYWIGSNALRIVTNAPCPAITVRTSYDINRTIRKIVMPIDHTAVTLHKVPYTATLARAFNAEVNIIALNSSKLKTIQRVIDNTVLKVEKYFGDHMIPFITEIQNTDNIASSILEHSRLVDADLISIMTDGDIEASGVLLDKFSQQLINYSTIPVLSNHPIEHFVL